MTGREKADAFLAEYQELCVRHGYCVGLALTGPPDRVTVQAANRPKVLAHVAILKDRIVKDHDPQPPDQKRRVRYDDDPAEGTGLGPFPVPVVHTQDFLRPPAGETVTTPVPDPVPVLSEAATPATTNDTGAGDWSGGSADAGGFDAGSAASGD